MPASSREVHLTPPKLLFLPWEVGLPSYPLHLALCGPACLRRLPQLTVTHTHPLGTLSRNHQLPQAAALAGNCPRGITWGGCYMVLET